MWRILSGSMLVILLAIVAISENANSQTRGTREGRCPAGESSCIDQLNQDTREFLKDKVPGYSNKDAAERAKGVGEIVKDCVNCLMDEYKTRMDEISNQHRRSLHLDDHD